MKMRVARAVFAMAVMLIALFAEPLFFAAEGPTIAPVVNVSITPKPSATFAVATAFPVITQSPTEIPQAYPPVNITILKAGVNAKVAAVGVDSNGRMEVPKTRHEVGWYEFGPSPGQPGNALFAGHNRWSRRDAVFARIYALEAGDEAEITLADGSVLSYIVETVSLYSYNDVPSEVMERGGDERVTLITCAGPFSRAIGTSEKRCVVILKPNRRLR